MRRPAFDALQHFLHPALEAVRGGGDFRARVFLAELRDEAGFVVAEIDGGNTALGGGNENFSERGFDNGVAELHAHAPFAIRRRGHAELRIAAFIDPAG